MLGISNIVLSSLIYRLYFFNMLCSWPTNKDFICVVFPVHGISIVCNLLSLYLVTESLFTSESLYLSWYLFSKIWYYLLQIKLVNLPAAVSCYKLWLGWTQKPYLLQDRMCHIFAQMLCWIWHDSVDIHLFVQMFFRMFVLINFFQEPMLFPLLESINLLRCFSPTISHQKWWLNWITHC